MNIDDWQRLGLGLAVAGVYIFTTRIQLLWIHRAGADLEAVPGLRFRLPQIAALCLHAWMLGLIFADGVSALGMLSLAALLIALMITLYGRWDPDAERLLLFMHPIAALSLPLAVIAHHPDSSIAWDAETWTHSALALIAFSLLGMAAMQGLALLILDRGLKQRRITEVMRYLPALQTQERIILRCLRLGAAMLLLAIASGFLFEENLPLYARIVFSSLALMSCLVPLFAHRMFGWRGRRLVWWTLSGLLLILLSYLAHLSL